MIQGDRQNMRKLEGAGRSCCFIQTKLHPAIYCQMCYILLIKNIYI